ncbi:uncharacterized protein [Antennarius striatus]|uniref:uncharacterized protein n=1 Tax=Antennarius striatus TaxID=241820 RepID=UPI0035B228F1
MIFVQKLLNVYITLSLLSDPVAMKERGPWSSLWGKVADFADCRYWKLQPQVSIPALRELTLCFDLKLEAKASLWTAFIYRHPEAPYAELGLGGMSGRIVVWIFGMEWTTNPINFNVSRWYSLCLTWTCDKDRPVLYIDGVPENIMSAQGKDTAPLISSSPCSKLAPNGTLTLGAEHFLVNGIILINPFTLLPGKLSLFRLWGRERSEQQVTSLRCTEGELIRWQRGDWNTKSCAPLPDPSLHCEWSTYRVNLMFDIFCYDGNKTEPYTVRDIAHRWLREVLPASMYLHKVSVFEVIRSSAEDSVETTSQEDRQVWWIVPPKRFSCLVHVTVIPSLDVAAVQNEMLLRLSAPYVQPSRLLKLQADAPSIQTTPVETFNDATISPGDVVTEPSSATTATFHTTTTISSTSSANLSNLYFEVHVNVSITGDCDAQQTISSWLNSTLPDDMMTLLDLQLLPRAHRDLGELKSNLPASEAVFVYGVSRYGSCSSTQFPFEQQQNRKYMKTYCQTYKIRP